MFDEDIRTALEDLNLHCTNHAPDPDCEGCRLQLRGMRFVDLEGPAGGARDEADARECDAGSSQSTGASVLLAAAPVPCAASPAGERLRAAVAGILLQLRSPVGLGYRGSLIDDLREALEDYTRATGEGARDDTLRRNADSVSGGSEVDGARTGAADRHQHRDIEPDRARARDGRGHDAEAVDVDAQQAAPVAVSLDPHRLRAIDAALSELRDYIKDRKRVKYQPHQCVVRAMQHLELARLRGEAAVRPSTYPIRAHVEGCPNSLRVPVDLCDCGGRDFVPESAAVRAEE
jgi:hypothetical protein